MSEQIPDAPWIREAERDGYPASDIPDEIECPCCGRLTNIIYTERNGWDAIGCDNCIHERPVWEWYEHNKDQFIPDWVDEKD